MWKQEELWESELIPCSCMGSADMNNPISNNRHISLTNSVALVSYKWRKYGQKYVKGYESPRSYFKCTYPKCKVKKRFHVSLDGLVTEIFYNGTHNHPKHPPCRRCGACYTVPIREERFVEKSTNSSWQACNGTQPNGIVDLSPPPENGEYADGPGLRIRRFHDGVDYDSENDSPSKRRRGETSAGNLISVVKSTPRVLVQTVAEVDRLNDGFSWHGGPTEVEPEDVNGKEKIDTDAHGTQLDHKSSGLPITSEGLSDDGYNWRKYGQKHVKGCEFPRSYYKCTHPNCEVKKLFERSPDGRITEIVYKGTHDHPRPPPGRRFGASSMVSIQEERFDRFLSLSGAERSTYSYGQTCNDIEPNGTLDLSPVAENGEFVEGADVQMQRVQDEVDDDGEDDSLSKRRKMETNGEDFTSVVKSIREPRVVVQTISEVDILDDGYRWRKYGQKVVRGNPNPRSYYKCTHAGCPAKRHVERAFHNPNAGFVAYIGQHNHDVLSVSASWHDTAGPSTPEHDAVRNDAVVERSSAAETQEVLHSELVSSVRPSCDDAAGPSSPEHDAVRDDAVVERSSAAETQEVLHSELVPSVRPSCDGAAGPSAPEHDAVRDDAVVERSSAAETQEVLHSELVPSVRPSCDDAAGPSAPEHDVVVERSSAAEPQEIMHSELVQGQIQPDSSSFKVDICQACGDEGFDVALIYCYDCEELAVHRYCLDVLPKTFEEYVVWYCDDCKPSDVKLPDVEQAQPTASESNGSRNLKSVSSTSSQGNDSHLDEATITQPTERCKSRRRRRRGRQRWFTRKRRHGH